MQKCCHWCAEKCCKVAIPQGEGALPYRQSFSKSFSVLLAQQDQLLHGATSTDGPDI
jgi:hypothetical protein